MRAAVWPWVNIVDVHPSIFFHYLVTGMPHDVMSDVPGLSFVALDMYSRNPRLPVYMWVY